MRRWQCLITLSVITVAITTERPLAVTHDSIENNNLTTASTIKTTNPSWFWVANNNLDNQSKQPEAQPSILQQLNLTWLQKQQIQQIHRQYQQRILQTKSQLQSLQEQLTEMMTGTDSIAAIRAKDRELVVLKQKVGELHFESMLETREVLTPEQRQKFKEIIESRQDE